MERREKVVMHSKQSDQESEGEDNLEKREESQGEEVGEKGEERIKV